MPPRLLEGEGEVAELLRKVERQARQAPSEAAAWERTLRGLGRDSEGGRLRVGMAAAAGALVGALALYVALSRSAHLRSAARTVGRRGACVSQRRDGDGDIIALAVQPELPRKRPRPRRSSPEI